MKEMRLSWKEKKLLEWQLTSFWLPPQAQLYYRDIRQTENSKLKGQQSGRWNKQKCKRVKEDADGMEVRK